jgi:hypothetical protein
MDTKEFAKAIGKSLVWTKITLRLLQNKGFLMKWETGYKVNGEKIANYFMDSLDLVEFPKVHIPKSKQTKEDKIIIKWIKASPQCLSKLITKKGKDSLQLLIGTWISEIAFTNTEFYPEFYFDRLIDIGIDDGFLSSFNSIQNEFWLQFENNEIRIITTFPELKHVFKIIRKYTSRTAMDTTLDSIRENILKKSKKNRMICQYCGHVISKYFHVGKKKILRKRCPECNTKIVVIS